MSRGFAVALGTRPANAHLNPEDAARLSRCCWTATSSSASSMDLINFQALDVTRIPHESNHYDQLVAISCICVDFRVLSLFCGADTRHRCRETAADLFARLISNVAGIPNNWNLWRASRALRPETQSSQHARPVLRQAEHQSGNDAEDDRANVHSPTVQL